MLTVMVTTTELVYSLDDFNVSSNSNLRIILRSKLGSYYSISGKIKGQRRGEGSASLGDSAHFSHEPAESGTRTLGTRSSNFKLGIPVHFPHLPVQKLELPKLPLHVTNTHQWFSQPFLLILSRKFILSDQWQLGTLV